LYSNHEFLLCEKEESFKYPADFVSSTVLQNWSKQAAASFAKVVKTEQPTNSKECSKMYTKKEINLISTHIKENAKLTDLFLESQRSY
tara:strand:+ start:1535 stop:1798 length:264 start_codon:yes stop_codon:yes gene_type:complete